MNDLIRTLIEVLRREGAGDAAEATTTQIMLTDDYDIADGAICDLVERVDIWDIDPLNGVELETVISDLQGWVDSAER